MIILSIAAVIVITVAVTYKTTVAEREKINKDNFCAEDLKEVTVVLIDHTDKLNTIQKSSLETRLLDLANELPKNYHEIKVFSVDKVTDKVLTPEIDLCNPGSKKEMNEYTENKKIVQKQYEDRFKNHLNEILDRIFNASSANQSPIMEALQSVSVTSFIGEKNNNVHKKLILVSDLLQHTSEFSLYHGIIDFSEYKKTDHWKSTKSDLSGVDVEIFFLHRNGDSSLQNSKLMDFWMHFFEQQGARVTRFLPIEG